MGEQSENGGIIGALRERLRGVEDQAIELRGDMGDLRHDIDGLRVDIKGLSDKLAPVSLERCQAHTKRLKRLEVIAYTALIVLGVLALMEEGRSVVSAILDHVL